MDVSQALKPFHKKIAQVCAYITGKMPGEKVAKLKLMKLLYLVDRASLETMSRPITYDDYKSFMKGPVPADTFASIYSGVSSLPWSAVLSHDTSGKFEVKAKDIGRLSDAELQIIDGVLLKYGRLSSDDLVELIHKLPEWKSNKGGQLTFREILKGINENRTDAEINKIIGEIDECRTMELMLAE